MYRTGHARYITRFVSRNGMLRNQSEYVIPVPSYLHIKSDFCYSYQVFPVDKADYAEIMVQLGRLSLYGNSVTGTTAPRRY